MRHVILLTLLVVQVIAFAFIELGSAVAFGSNEGEGPILAIGFFYTAVVEERAMLVALAVAASLTVTARSIDLSLVAMAAMIMALMTRFSPGAAVTFGAVPGALILGGLLGAAHGWLVGTSLRRAALITLAALVAYRAAAMLAIGPDAFGAFEGTDGYADLVGGYKSLFPILLGMVAIVAVASWIARRAVNRDPHPLDPDPPSRSGSFPTGWRIALFALAGVLVGAAAVVQTSINLEASATWSFGGSAFVVASLVIGGWFAPTRRAPTLAVLLAAMNLAVLDYGLDGVQLAHADALPLDLTAMVGPITIIAMVVFLAIDFRTQPSPEPVEE